jgi:hypothetical protein
MNPSRRLWTGIAALTLALTVAEVAAVGVVARGAERWWRGEDARALRRAGAAVASVVTERLGLGGDRRPVVIELARIEGALAPLVRGGGRHALDCDPCTLQAPLVAARVRTRVIRQVARLELREAWRRVEREAAKDAARLSL